MTYSHLFDPFRSTASAPRLEDLAGDLADQLSQPGKDATTLGGRLIRAQDAAVHRVLGGLQQPRLLHPMQQRI
jgi:hypothetical protein